MSRRCCAAVRRYSTQSFPCKLGTPTLNCIFSLGLLQWRICKCEDGPRFDFSSGTSTLCHASFWDAPRFNFFASFVAVGNTDSILAKLLWWDSHMIHVYCKWASDNSTTVCLSAHTVSSECLHCSKQSLFEGTAGCINKAKIDQSFLSFIADGLSELVFWMCEMLLAVYWMNAAHWITTGLFVHRGPSASSKWKAERYMREYLRHIVQR